MIRQFLSKDLGPGGYFIISRGRFFRGAFALLPITGPLIYLTMTQQLNFPTADALLGRLQVFRRDEEIHLGIHRRANIVPASARPDGRTDSRIHEHGRRRRQTAPLSPLRGRGPLNLQVPASRRSFCPESDKVLLSSSMERYQDAMK